MNFTSENQSSQQKEEKTTIKVTVEIKKCVICNEMFEGLDKLEEHMKTYHEQRTVINFGEDKNGEIL